MYMYTSTRVHDILFLTLYFEPLLTVVQPSAFYCLFFYLTFDNLHLLYFFVSLLVIFLFSFFSCEAQVNITTRQRVTYRSISFVKRIFQSLLYLIILCYVWSTFEGASAKNHISAWMCVLVCTVHVVHNALVTMVAVPCVAAPVGP